MYRLLCFALWAVLLTDGQPTVVQGADGFYQLQPQYDAVLRGQSPEDSNLSLPNGFGPGSGLYNPFRPPPATTPQDPFLLSPYDGVPGPSPWSPQYGKTGPIPYRYGWTPKLDLGYLPSAHTQPDVGNFSAFELDSELVYNTPVGSDLVFTMAPQFNYRHWDASSAFTKDLFRFGANFQLATPAAAPWGYQLAFNPSVNTDFGSPLTNDSINLDANGAMFFRLDPAWQLVLGVGYLDRVHDIIIPYAGLVYVDDFWEFRLMFPQGRVSRYVGDFWWGSHWLYMAWEYHVESYEVTTPVESQNQIQLEDYRLTFGLRSDHAGFTKYLEAGYVFGRNIDYKYGLPGFDISSGFIVRGGIRF